MTARLPAHGQRRQGGACCPMSIHSGTRSVAALGSKWSSSLIALKGSLRVVWSILSILSGPLQCSCRWLTHTQTAPSAGGRLHYERVSYSPIQVKWFQRSVVNHRSVASSRSSYSPQVRRVPFAYERPLSHSTTTVALSPCVLRRMSSLGEGCLQVAPHFHYVPSPACQMPPRPPAMRLRCRCRRATQTRSGRRQRHNDAMLTWQK
mmetsp:Transcript_53786/g.139008  ORF Transcript_53786/g.139008 Transcript_53786/m.139008 type:complete len:206 (+) Transcript_53786:222-839(+)